MAENWHRQVLSWRSSPGHSTQCVHGSEDGVPDARSAGVQQVTIVKERPSAQDLRDCCPGCQCYLKCRYTSDPGSLEYSTVPGRTFLLFNADCMCVLCYNLKEEMKEMYRNMEEYASSVLVSSQEGATSTVRSISVMKSWKSEEYAVKKQLVDQILTTFGLKEEELIDVFSSVSNARFKRRVEGDAWQLSWAPPQMCWWNPPFSRLQDCVVKVLVDDAQGVFIAPDWKSGWLSLLQKIAKKELFFEPGSDVFELEGRQVGPVRWGVHAFFVQQKNTVMSEAMKRRRRREKEKK